MWRKILPTLLATTSYHWPPELPSLKPYNTGSVRQRRRTKQEEVVASATRQVICRAGQWGLKKGPTGQT